MLTKPALAVAAVTAAAAATPALGQVAGLDGAAIGDNLFRFGPLGVLVWITYIFVQFLQTFLKDERESRAAIIREFLACNQHYTEQLGELTAVLAERGLQVARSPSKGAAAV